MRTFIQEKITAAFIGEWFTHKYRARASESGTYAVAKQLRKQGVPLQIALLVLLKDKS